MRIPLLVLLGGCLLSAGCGDGNGDRARASATPSAESESDEVLREAVVEALREAGQEQDDRAEQAVTFAEAALEDEFKGEPWYFRTLGQRDVISVRVLMNVAKAEAVRICSRAKRVVARYADLPVSVARTSEESLARPKEIARC